MKITMADMTVVQRSFPTASAVTGYVAHSIELEPNDVRNAVLLIDSGRIDELRLALVQLQARWPSERAGGTIP